MAGQSLFGRAVGFHLPSAVPVQLERVDDFVLGKVLIYQRKPRLFLPCRKHKLSFTDYALSDLLVKDSNLTFATETKFLFEVGKGTETVGTTVSSDAEIKGALNLLSMKVKGKYNSQASIATDFGKVSYTTTDLLRVLSDKTYSLDTSNPIVREAIAKGSTLFVISTLYEAEHSSISVKLVDSESETAEGDAKVAKVGGEVDETVTHTDTYFQATTRDVPTPIAFLVLKLSIGRTGRLTPQLRSGQGHKTKVNLPFDTFTKSSPRREEMETRLL